MCHQVSMSQQETSLDLDDIRLENKPRTPRYAAVHKILDFLALKNGTPIKNFKEDQNSKNDLAVMLNGKSVDKEYSSITS